MSDKQALQTFGQRLKAYRVDEREWTLKQMAAFVGVSWMTIYRIENALVTPNDITMARIKKAIPHLADQEVA